MAGGCRGVLLCFLRRGAIGIAEEGVREGGSYSEDPCMTALQ